MLTKKITIICWVTTILFIGGCAGVSIQYIGSRPTGGQIPLFLDINDSKFELPGASLNIQPRNEIKKSEFVHLSVLPLYIDKNKTNLYKDSVFKVQVSIQPHRKGFSFNPQKTFLEIDGSVYSVLKVIGPKPPRSKLRDATIKRWIKQGGVVCSIRSPNSIEWDNHETNIINLTELEEWYCFDLIFDVKPPMPEKEFTMTIEGIYSDNQPIKMKKIFFEKAEWSAYSS